MKFDKIEKIKQKKWLGITARGSVIYFFIFHFSFFIFHSTLAQQRPTYGPSPVANDDKVFLLPGADSITFARQPDGTEVRRVVNNVVFRHKGALIDRKSVV